MREKLVILFLLSILSGASVEMITGPGENGDASSVEGEKYNVVVISVDALRADHLNCYGYHRNTAPNICGFGEPVIFENAYSQAPWSLQSYVSMLTGQWPSSHQVRSPKYIDNDLRLLPEILSSKGYKTAGFVDGGMLNHWTNMDQGFDTYVSMRSGEGPVGHNQKVFSSGARYLKNTSTPSFVLLHSMEVHDPYRPGNATLFNSYRPGNLSSDINVSDDNLSSNDGYRDRKLTQKERKHIIAGYDSSIRQTDRYIGRFMEELKSSGELENTIVIITSDHGESFQDHGTWVGHGKKLHEEMIKVPLVIYHPDLDGQRLKERVRVIDIVPTILEFLEIEDEEGGFDGRSLLSMINGSENSDRPVYSSTYLYENKSALIQNNLKLIWNAEDDDSKLFNLSQDPGELRDISSSNRDVVRSMKESIGGLREGGEINENLRNSRIQERLEELGYR